MRELALAGALAVVFGLGSFYATGHFGAFSGINLAAGGAALLVALAVGARRLRVVGGPHSRPVIARGVAWIVGALVIATAMERAAAWSGVTWDWTLEGRYELAPATVDALAVLPGTVRLLLFRDALDPRVRRTRLLLRQLAARGDVEIVERELEQHLEEADRYEIASSNTVVVELGGRFVTVERPTEGSLFEALYALRDAEGGVIALLRGEGQGDPERQDELGFSGLAAALATEGYELRSFVSAALDEVPEEVRAVVAIAPERSLRAETIDALRRYLDRGGSLVAFLEPGRESGIEALLGEFGLSAPGGLLIDPASGSVESLARGVGIVAYNYETHPGTQGLDRNRMTFFPGARPLVLRRTRSGATVKCLVYASPRSWISEDLGLLARPSARPEADGARQEYHCLVAAGVFPQDGRSARVVAFGDAQLASNRYLRSLYNLDLVVNAVHWAVERESEITLRPKVGAPVQFPLPIANTLRALYGVGLLVPELMLIAGGVVWLRRRSG